MRKVEAPVFQILLRHHDDGRVSNRTGRANDAFADGTEYSGFRNVQQTAQLACADERQIVTGTWKVDSHAHMPMSTRTNRANVRRNANLPSLSISSRDDFSELRADGSCRHFRGSRMLGGSSFPPCAPCAPWWGVNPEIATEHERNALALPHVHHVPHGRETP
jgi:hypothetical protein